MSIIRLIFLHHPKSLLYLSLIELWERFGFYIAQGLLILFMTQYLHIDDITSSSICGVFLGLIFISSLIGGYLADKQLGYKISLFYGGVFLTIGYAILSLTHSESTLYLALSNIIIGNGLFKPTISTLLGMQYGSNNFSRDAGFTLFYIGVNTGAILSGISGYVKDFAGWHVTYLLASVGMILSLVTLVAGLKYIILKESRAVTFRKHVIFMLSSLLGILLLKYTFHIKYISSLLMIISFSSLILVLTISVLKQSAEYRYRLIMLSVLIFTSIIFWALFLQIFISVNLFIDRLVEKQLFGLKLNTTVFYASQSVFILLLGSLFAWAWQLLGRNNLNPSPFLKFLIGIVFAGLAFSLLSVSTLFPLDDGLISPFWIFASYFLLTIGELFLSPIGLSAITVLSPTHLTGTMMGLWFMSVGIGGFLAGKLAKVASIPIGVSEQSNMIGTYHHAFLMYAMLAFVASSILALIGIVYFRPTRRRFI